MHGLSLHRLGELGDEVTHRQALVSGSKPLDQRQRWTLAAPLRRDLPEVSGICSGVGGKCNPLFAGKPAMEFGESHADYLSAELSSVQLLSALPPGYSAPAVKTVHESRRARLVQLVEKMGTAKAVSDATGIPAPQISQVINPYQLKSGKLKTLGDDLARQADEQLGKPAGWMDTDPDFERAAWPFHTLTPDQLEQISPEVVKAAERMLLASVPPRESKGGSPLEPAIGGNGPLTQGNQWKRTQEGKDRAKQEQRQLSKRHKGERS